MALEARVSAQRLEWLRIGSAAAIALLAYWLWPQELTQAASVLMLYAALCSLVVLLAKPVLHAKLA